MHPLLLGHRGCRGRAYGVPENTIAAFDLALQHGCDGFEFDVRLTSDGCAVICHGSRSAGINIARAKASQLTRLQLLEEVLQRYASVFLDIEVKVGGVVPCLLPALSEHPPQNGYVVSSFIPDVLLDLRLQHSSLPLGLICETPRQLLRWPELPIQYVIAKEPLVESDLVQKVHAAGMSLLAWTVNSKRSMLRLASMGIDGIISDKTDLLVETLRSAELKPE